MCVGGVRGGGGGEEGRRGAGIFVKGHGHIGEWYIMRTMKLYVSRVH